MSSGNTEIISIGNEILIGDVLDTNANWLCRRVTDLGGRVTRVTTVRDDLPAIFDAVRSSLYRGADVLFTSGGLGPTDDDMTICAIGLALERALEENPRALAMLEKTYRDLADRGLAESSRLTPERRKMAKLPDDAEPYWNPVGAAPGVVLWEGRTAVISLPGVPEELKGIFETSLPPVLVELYGNGSYAERSVRVKWGDESTLAPVINAVAGRHAEVYVKSRAKPYGPGVQLTITLSARGESEGKVEALLDAAQEDLLSSLEAGGIRLADPT